MKKIFLAFVVTVFGASCAHNINRQVANTTRLVPGSSDSEIFDKINENADLNALCGLDNRDLLIERLSAGIYPGDSELLDMLLEKMPKSLPFVAACLIDQEGLRKVNETTSYSEIFRDILESRGHFGGVFKLASRVFPLLANSATVNEELPEDVQSKLDSLFHSLVKISMLYRAMPKPFSRAFIDRTPWVEYADNLAKALHPMYLKRIFSNHKISIPTENGIFLIAKLFGDQNYYPTLHDHSIRIDYINDKLPGIYQTQYHSVNINIDKRDQMVRELETQASEVSYAKDALAKACSEISVAASATPSYDKFWTMKYESPRPLNKQNENLQDIGSSGQIKAYCSSEVPLL